MSSTKLSLTTANVTIPESFSKTDICRLFIASINGPATKVYMRLDKEYAVFDTSDSSVRYGHTKDMDALSFGFVRYLAPDESLEIFGKSI